MGPTLLNFETLVVVVGPFRNDAPPSSTLAPSSPGVVAQLNGVLVMFKYYCVTFSPNISLVSHVDGS